MSLVMFNTTFEDLIRNEAGQWEDAARLSRSLAEKHQKLAEEYYAKAESCARTGNDADANLYREMQSQRLIAVANLSDSATRYEGYAKKLWAQLEGRKAGSNQS